MLCLDFKNVIHNVLRVLSFIANKEKKQQVAEVVLCGLVVRLVRLVSRGKAANTIFPHFYSLLIAALFIPTRRVSFGRSFRMI